MLDNQYLGSDFGPKKVLLWCLVIMTLAFAFGAISYVSAYRNSVAYQSFGAAGEGKVVVVPDIATFSFGVITEANNTNVAGIQETNTEKVNSILNQLKELGIKDEDIATENYTLNPRYQFCGARAEICPPSSIVGYSINQTVAVKIRNFEHIAQALSIAAGSGATNISRLQFNVDDLEAVKNEARAEAIKSAQVQAKAIAKAGGFKLGRILSIDDTGGFEPYARMESAVMGLGSDSAFGVALPPVIEPGSTEVIVRMMIRYQIK